MGWTKSDSRTVFSPFINADIITNDNNAGADVVDELDDEIVSSSVTKT